MFKKISEGDVVASMRAAGSRVAILSDGKLLCTLWYEEGVKSGIRFVKLEIE